MFRVIVNVPNTVPRALRVLPALMIMTCGGLWARSYLVSDSLALGTPGGLTFGLMSTRGMLQFQYYRQETPQLGAEVEHWKWVWYRSKPGRLFGQPNFWQRLGFDFYTSPYASMKWARVVVPWWAITTVCAIPIARRSTKSVLGRRRRNASRCPHCGYDLRGVAGRCPECGEPAPAAQPPLASTDPPA